MRDHVFRMQGEIYYMRAQIFQVFYYTINMDDVMPHAFHESFYLQAQILLMRGEIIFLKVLRIQTLEEVVILNTYNNMMFYECFYVSY